MRGEDGDVNPPAGVPVGSPPHARGRRLSRGWMLSGLRITPACAGKTVRFPRESDKVVLQFTNFS